MAQGVGQRTKRARLDALDVVPREDQLLERREIAEPMSGHHRQPVAGERETLKLMKTGERARLDRADQTIAQL